jgi:hypothetical protein
MFSEEQLRRAEDYTLKYIILNEVFDKNTTKRNRFAMIKARRDCMKVVSELASFEGIDTDPHNFEDTYLKEFLQRARFFVCFL